MARGTQRARCRLSKITVRCEESKRKKVNTDSEADEKYLGAARTVSKFFFNVCVFPSDDL